MNKHNLIKLGAFAQKMFEMKDGFKIMEMQPELPNVSTVEIDENFPGAKIDVVTLEKASIKDDDGNFESMRIGYSAKANVLVIKE